MPIETVLDVGGAPRDKSANPLSLLISLIREVGGSRDNESAHKKKFRQLLNSDAYIDYRDSLIDEWVRIKYSTALNAALPLSTKELAERAARRKEKQANERKAIEALKHRIKSKFLDVVMPNGKPLSACTGIECAEFGDWYERLGSHVGTRLVGEVFKTENSIKKFVFGKKS